MERAAENEAIVLLNELQELDAEFPILLANKNESLQQVKLRTIQIALLRFAASEIQDVGEKAEQE